MLLRLAVIALALAGCASAAGVHPTPIATPAEALVIIWSPGQLAGGSSPCRPDNINGDWGVPTVIHALDGVEIGGYQAVVDPVCYQPYATLREHADQLAERVAGYRRLGLPRTRIFLAGHSGGGWASLFALARDGSLANAAVVFAPAYYGRAAEQSYPQRVRRAADLGYMSTRPIAALIYAFPGDIFEPPEALGDLRRSGPEFVEFDGAGCSTEPHLRMRDACFIRAEQGHIRAFIEQRLAIATASTPR